MATFLSPGVTVTEIDNSLGTAATSVSVGAAVLNAGVGPVMEPQLIDSETTLVNVFGKPTNDNFKQWWTIANFLAYSNACYVTRIATDNQFNANSKGLTGWEYETYTNSKGETIRVRDSNGKEVKTHKGLVINNLREYEASYEDGNGDYGLFAARYPGSLGNSIMVTIADAASYDSWQWTDENGGVHDWRKEFNLAPGTSAYASVRDGSNDEVHVLVVDAGGRVTGTKGTILEKYGFLSKGSDCRSLDGISNNYVKVLKEQSEYVYVMDYPEESDLIDNYNHSVQYLIEESCDDVAAAKQAILTNPATVVGQFVVNVKEQTIDVVDSRLEVVETTDEQGNDIVVKKTVLYLKEAMPIKNWFGQVVRVVDIESDSSVSSLYEIIKDETILDSNGAPGYNAVPKQQGESKEGSWGSDVIGTNFKSLRAPIVSRLSGGADDFEYTDGQEELAYDIYKDKDVYDIGLIPVGAASADVFAYVIQNICETRMDCVAFGSPNNDRAPFLGHLSSEDRQNGVTTTDIKIMNQTLDWRNTTFNVVSSYGHLDSGWKYQYDQYNDVNRWVPLNGDCAGIYARVDETNAPWWSGAGYNRGQIKNIIKVNFNPNQTQRDQLYQQNINPVVEFAGEGTILYGDRTLLTKPSAFRSINIRRLFIYLEKVLSTAAKYLLFEFNDMITRNYAISLVEPVLRDVQGSRGIYQYKIICNESNNTAEIIDANKFVMDISIAPARSINFIALNFVCEKTGSSAFLETGG